MKTDYKNYFKGKKITVMGLGLLGRGIGVTKFLAECGAVLTVTDLKTKEQLAPALKQLSKFKNIKYVLGEHKPEDFRHADIILKAGGVPLDSIYIAEARKNNIPIEMDEALFARLVPPGVLLVGVTGTRGKSTVTHLLFAILNEALRLRSGQKNSRIFLAGNVRGQATLPLLKKVKGGDVVVMELDSWRLQGFGESKISPNIAVFTNFMNDHQNYYRNNLGDYFADKANIYCYQTVEDILITNLDTQKLITKNKFPAKAKKVIARSSNVPTSWKIKLLGEHNKQNIAYAVAAARALGVGDLVIKKAVESFVGLPGRMELVREVGGVKFYNDTNGTTPDAVLAALEALKKYHGKIVLLGGGTDKNLDYSNYIKTVPKAVKALILFKGTATDKIIAGLPNTTKLPVFVVESMKLAVDLAKEQVVKGDVVLLSPGAASFGVFKNEYDRGDQFVKLVKKIK